MKNFNVYHVSTTDQKDATEVYAASPKAAASKFADSSRASLSPDELIWVCEANSKRTVFAAYVHQL